MDGLDAEAQLSCHMSRIASLRSASHDVIQVHPQPKSRVMAFLRWWTSWALPGMGMFSESYMVSGKRGSAAERKRRQPHAATWNCMQAPAL